MEDLKKFFPLKYSCAEAPFLMPYTDKYILSKNASYCCRHNIKGYAADFQRLHHVELSEKLFSFSKAKIDGLNIQRCIFDLLSRKVVINFFDESFVSCTWIPNLHAIDSVCMQTSVSLNLAIKYKKLIILYWRGCDPQPLAISHSSRVSSINPGGFCASLWTWLTPEITHNSYCVSTGFLCMEKHTTFYLKSTKGSSS